jgi:hypothetical protein
MAKDGSKKKHARRQIRITKNGENKCVCVCVCVCEGVCVHLCLRERETDR